MPSFTEAEFHNDVSAARKAHREKYSEVCKIRHASLAKSSEYDANIMLDDQSASLRRDAVRDKNRANIKRQQDRKNDLMQKKINYFLKPMLVMTLLALAYLAYKYLF